MLDISKALRKSIYISPTGNKQNVYIFACIHCGNEMRKTSYYAKKSTGYCYKCNKGNTKSRILQEKQICRFCKVEKSNIEFYKRNGLLRTECKKCVNLKHNFNITEIEYNNLLKIQNNCCAICKSNFSHNHQNGKSASLAVDHCHDTGKIRGLLCSKCNLGLGQFKDNENFLIQAIEYLKGAKLEQVPKQES